MSFSYSDELYHYGIFGQKWGIRRYQNEDGTYTEAGKERYRTTNPYASTGFREVTGSHRKTVFEEAEEENRRREEKSNRKRDAEKTADDLLTQRKKGKDKPPSSPAEDVLKETGKAIDSADHLARTADKISKRKKKQDTPDLSDMSNEEIKQKIERMRLEQQYNDLTREDTVSGWEKTSEILGLVKDVVVIGGSIATIAATVHSIKKG